MELGLKVNDLPNGQWTVSWGQENYVQEDSTRNGLMYLLFDEMNLPSVKFGIVLNNGELETLHVDSIEYWQRTSDHGRCVLSNYVLGGVVFDTEEPARKFTEILHQLYFMSLLTNGL